MNDRRKDAAVLAQTPLFNYAPIDIHKNPATGVFKDLLATAPFPTGPGAIARFGPPQMAVPPGLSAAFGNLAKNLQAAQPAPANLPPGPWQIPALG
jgi:hypothetical protein